MIFCGHFLTNWLISLLLLLCGDAVWSWISILSIKVYKDVNVKMTKDSNSIKEIKSIILPLLYSKFVLDDIHIMTLLLDPIMKFWLVHLHVERNHIEHAKDKLKHATIKYALLDDKEKDVPSTRSLIKRKARSSILMYDHMLKENDENDTVSPLKITTPSPSSMQKLTTSTRRKWNTRSPMERWSSALTVTLAMSSTIYCDGGARAKTCIWY